MARSGTQFGAAGSDGTILVSADGLNRNVLAPPLSAHNIDVVSTGEQFIVVGDYPSVPSSQNGLLWTKNSIISAGYKLMNGVCCAVTHFLAVGRDSTVVGNF